MIENSVVPLLYIGSLYFVVSTLVFSPKVDSIANIVFLVVVTFFVLRIISSSFQKFVFSFIHAQENSDAKEKQASGLILIVNIVIWIIGIIFMIDNLGYDVTSLIAGLGIGGIAIALAAQTILGDLFSYFVIFFDRPFEIGDFVVIDDKSGVIEYIGIKTTRIRTLGGEQLVCSNTDLTNSRLHNYKRLEKRRILFNLGVTYQTSHKQLSEIPEMIRQVIQSKPYITFDRAHFSGYGDFSLNFEVVYYVQDADYTFYMDKQQSIYLDIFEAFEQSGIDFAYPTQTLMMQLENTHIK
ncbi:mechanosensitive ion channel family protein [Dyadobacter alkalitolerans]|uniref:mechanosensitive ion channel family protein n=1 Tax=Dyadobacter alkalitolerans TaxID=492736 RepID=UPI001E5E114B|nr:mechanosensitive ion channel family protein [Dyadobacter alkalitolerans]